MDREFFEEFKNNMPLSLKKKKRYKCCELLILCFACRKEWIINMDVNETDSAKFTNNTAKNGQMYARHLVSIYFSHACLVSCNYICKYTVKYFSIGMYNFHPFFVGFVCTIAQISHFLA